MFRSSHSNSNPYDSIMKPLSIIVPSLFALFAASCAPQKSAQRDTPPSPGYADASQSNAPSSQSTNPVYDSTPAYDESSGAITPVAPGTVSPNVPEAATIPATSSPHGMTPAAPSAPKTPLAGSIVHTVVAGDTLSGISAKYKVPAASIKTANDMTKDTVILGRRMIIPAH